MKWVTRQTVHLDRVASPWLIKRFVDPDAQFLFIDPDGPWSDDATPFALPGAALGMHDHDGTTFDKILRTYRLHSPVLADMAAVIRAGVHHVLQEDQGDAPESVIQLGVAWALLSEGLMLQRDDDQAIIDASMEMYDSLFAAFWARRLDARSGREVFWERMAAIRSKWRHEAPLSPQA
jgi:hypothetical protein